MSDRRMQSSRDDRRRDRDGPDRRRRSRSPRGGAAAGGGGRREYGDVDSYSSSRNYREREREDRYQGGAREERPRDREWDRGTARRDARRDDGDRRRDNRRDRDLFDDRRGPRRDDRRDRDRDGRGEGRENPTDKARDNDDMRQMERQTRVKSASPPPRKPKEPTPDLTDVPSVLTRKRRLNQWDIKPPGYENVTAEQAKLSGMFPLPGAPRQQPMDPSKLQAFMNQPGNQASTNALKPATARQSKRLFVHRLPASATDESVTEFFNLQLNGLNVTKGVDPCISAQVNQAQGYALLEFKNSEDATNAMALDGLNMEPHAMDTSNGDSNGGSKGLEIRRPKDYIVPTITDDTQNEAGVLSNTVPDTQNKIGITNIPIYLNDEQMQELLQSFGELKSFVLVKDSSTEQSRGIAFCEYVDPNVTDAAVESLNGMELGDAALKVKRASIGIQQVSGEMSVNAMSLMAGTQAKSDAEAGRVLCLMNMITPEELMDTEESEGKLILIRPFSAPTHANFATEILDDVKEECAKYGKVLDTKMPRPTGRQGAGIGKIYVKYEEPASAQKALAALAGRKFADRTVVVTFYGEEYFDINAW
jgi:splicing factor U2AF subunit